MDIDALVARYATVIQLCVAAAWLVAGMVGWFLWDWWVWPMLIFAGPPCAFLVAWSYLAQPKEEPGGDNTA